MFKFCCICAGKDRQNRPIKEVFAGLFARCGENVAFFALCLIARLVFFLSLCDRYNEN